MNIHERIDLWIREDSIILFEKIGLQSDSIIIDFGCGYGEYSASAALFLKGSGTVYAVDCNTVVLKYMKEKIEQYQLDNVRIIKTDGELPLDIVSKSADMMLLVDVIHTGENVRSKLPIRYKLYEEAHRALKPRGILAVAPFELTHFRDRNGQKTRYTINKLIMELEEYGFQLTQRLDSAIHFEKYHSPYQWKIHNNDLRFEDLETGPILSFIQKST